MYKSFGREVAGVLLRAVVVVLTIVIVIVSISYLYDAETSISDGTCNIAVLPVEGVILPYYGLLDYPMIVTPEMVESFLETVENDENIDAVLAEINSPGGTPVASERIAKRFRDSPLPVVGMIGDIGASGGYMIAAATDYLIASPMSDVGSIGVTMSYVENSKQNEEEGLTFVNLSTGEFKNAGNPNKPLSEAERALFEENLEVIHDEFVSLVADYRDMEISVVETLANGSSMPGAKAVEAGLVDSLGGRVEAAVILADILETDISNIRFCEYEASILPF